MADERNDSGQDRICQGAVDSLDRRVMDSISAHVAILDKQGVIVETNRAWRRFAADAGASDPTSLGMNYLAVSDKAARDGDPDAQAAAEGIRAVMRGEVTEFLHDYPCHSPAGSHWFYLRAIRLSGSGPLKIIISHEEITALKLAQEQLRRSKETLEEQKQELEEANIALKVLLKQRDADKHEMEQAVLSNIQELIFPFLKKLRSGQLRPREKTIVDIIENHLKEIASPLLRRMANIHIVLSPQELQVAALIKNGKSSKEIAEVLNIAEATVHFHRKNLRNKFGLKNRSVNLRTHLLSITE